MGKKNNWLNRLLFLAFVSMLIFLSLFKILTNHSLNKSLFFMVLHVVHFLSVFQMRWCNLQFYTLTARGTIPSGQEKGGQELDRRSN